MRTQYPCFAYEFAEPHCKLAVLTLKALTSGTRLSDFHFFKIMLLEKMSVLPTTA